MFKIFKSNENPKQFLGTRRNLIIAKNTYTATSMIVMTLMEDVRSVKLTQSIKATKPPHMRDSVISITMILIFEPYFLNFSLRK